MSLLGIDAGTTACKVAAFAETGALLAVASREYPLRTPAPGRLELDPDEVWRAVCSCLREVNGQLAADPVTALAISAQGEAVRPVARDGRVLAFSPVTADARGAAEMARLIDLLGKAHLAEVTGQPPHPMFTLAKLAWWAAHEPELVASTWKFLCYGDLLSWRLGGAAAIDLSMAARTMAFDIHRLAWSREILEAARIAIGQMPEAVPAGTPIGRVKPALARELGFTGQPAIVAGGHDQPCGALGAGVTREREAMFAIGTSICLAPVFDEPMPALAARDYPCYPHVVPGKFITLAGSFTGGSLLRWHRDVLGGEERRLAAETGRDVYDLLTELAGDQPSPVLLLPHFAGAGAPYNDVDATGALVGLTFGTTRGEIVRAELEAVMLEAALNREALGEAGVLIDAVTAIGGGARSDRWLQIAADVLGIPVRRSRQPEAACFGAARLAARASGRLATDPLAEVTSSGDDRGVENIFTPDPDTHAYYRQRLPVVRSLYEALRAMNHLR